MSFCLETSPMLLYNGLFVFAFYLETIRASQEFVKMVEICPVHHGIFPEGYILHNWNIISKL